MAPFGYAFRPYKSGQSRSRGWGETRMAFQFRRRRVAFRVSRASHGKLRATSFAGNDLSRRVDHVNCSRVAI